MRGDSTVARSHDDVLIRLGVGVVTKSRPQNFHV